MAFAPSRTDNYNDNQFPKAEQNGGIFEFSVHFMGDICRLSRIWGLSAELVSKKGM